MIGLSCRGHPSPPQPTSYGWISGARKSLRPDLRVASLPGSRRASLPALQASKAVSRVLGVEGRGGVCFRSTEQELQTSIWRGLVSSEGPIGFVFFSF